MYSNIQPFVKLKWSMIERSLPPVPTNSDSKMPSKPLDRIPVFYALIASKSQRLHDLSICNNIAIGFSDFEVFHISFSLFHLDKILYYLCNIMFNSF